MRWWGRQRRQKLREESRATRDRRLQVFRALFLVAALLIVFRLFRVQVVDHGFYEALASGQHDIFRELLPERGEIFVRDRDGTLFPVATNRELFTIWADLRKIDNPTRTARLLAELLPLDELELKAKLSETTDPYEPLARSVPQEIAERIRSLELLGIGLAPVPGRAYPERGLGGQVLGFFGSNEEGDQGGRYGLEGYFDELLRGRQGTLAAERDAAGRIIAVARRALTPAEDGVDLILTIDRRIQFFACERLKLAVRRHGARGGSVTVLDPKTGAVLALCGAPDFDPNTYAEVEDISVFNNPATFLEYEPGSVFKPITMAAAIDTDTVGPETTYVDEGAVTISSHTIKNSDGKSYGVQTMTQVLEQSLNTGAIFAMREAGPSVLRAYTERFGFGKPTGIDLHTEVSGDVSSLSKRGEIYAATASFGQGITVTPIQLAAAFGALANEGKLMQPYVVNEIVYPNDERQMHEPTLVRQVVSARTATLLEAMLTSVVRRGHGKRAGVPGYWIAGKTGTAQVPKKDGPGYEPGVTIGTFAGFGPVPDPRFVITVRIDHPRDVQFAESSAAPLFGEIAQFILQYYGVPPSRPVE